MVLPGLALHVIQRGNNRAPCFVDRSDYARYLLHLHELSGKYECSLHAYCLMPNHVHLLLTPATPEACSGLMKALGQRYVQYFNRRYTRTGSLFEGRFRSCVTDSAQYVMACYRYIELNPVRAQMVEHASDYEWSSHRANVGARGDPLVSPHVEYLALAQTPEARRTAYAGLFEQVLEPGLLVSIRKATNAGHPLTPWGQCPGTVPG